MRRPLTTGLVALALGLAACGDEATRAVPSTPGVASAATVPGAAATPTVPTASTGPGVPAGADDPCAGVPSPERVGELFGATMSQYEPLIAVAVPNGPFEYRCETSDGMAASASFGRSGPAGSVAELQATLRQLGYAMTPVDAMPGAYAYGAAVEIVVGDVVYTVSTTALDTLGVESPLTVERGTTLLTEWLTGLGVTP